MIPRLVYVVGPYTGPTVQIIETHVRQAVAVARLAVELGFSPICPHAQGWLGAYGPGDESEPLTRIRAISVSCQLAELVGRQGGDLWVIRREDRTLSEGTHLELEAFERGRTEFQADAVSVSEKSRWMLARRWSEWVAAGAVERVAS